MMTGSTPYRPLSTLLAVVLFVCCLSTTACAKNMAEQRLPVAVNVPASVYDGTGFLCAVTGTDVQKVIFSFLDRTVEATATATKGAEDKDITTAIAMLPVPLDHEPEQKEIYWEITYRDGSSTRGSAPIAIVRKDYPVQKLTLQRKYVTPDPELKERIQNEAKIKRPKLRYFSPEKHWTLPMTRPLPGEITSLFGLRRVLNGETRGFHRGVDFDGRTGDPVKCIADGKVILASELYYEGNCVMVDHGLGVVSVYMHFSEFKVEEGQEVKAGDILGLVGSTGRSTGPHLHLSLYVLGQSVDALPLLEPGSLPPPSFDKWRNQPATSKKKVTKKSSRKTKKSAAKTRTASKKKTAKSKAKKR